MYISDTLKISITECKKKLGFWVNKGVLQEVKDSNCEPSDDPFLEESRIKYLPCEILKNVDNIVKLHGIYIFIYSSCLFNYFIRIYS